MKGGGGNSIENYGEGITVLVNTFQAHFVKGSLIFIVLRINECPSRISTCQFTHFLTHVPTSTCTLVCPISCDNSYYSTSICISITFLPQFFTFPFISYRRSRTRYLCKKKKSKLYLMNENERFESRVNQMSILGR